MWEVEERRGEEEGRGQQKVEDRLTGWFHDILFPLAFIVVCVC